MKQIAEFLAGASNNAWLQIGPVHVYVRKGVHSIGGKVERTFDVASIEIPEALRGQGIFKAFMLNLETYLRSVYMLNESETMVLYVESVLNPRLVASLPAMGYTRLLITNPPCFFKRLF